MQDSMLLSFLLDALGIGPGSGPTPQYMGTGNYYSGNITSMQPGMLQSLLKAFLPIPSAQQHSPNSMLASSFRLMQQRQIQRNEINNLYSVNPMALDLASKGLEQVFGWKGARSLFVQGGAPTFMGQMLSMAWGSTAGPMLGDTYGDRGRQSRLLYDTLAGTYFGRKGGISLGLRAEEAQGVIENLASTTQRGAYGLFKKGRFDVREMVDIARMGADWGLFSGADKEDVPRRINQLADTIGIGLSVYGSLYKNMRKEDVVKRIMDLTAGTMPITSGANASQLMVKVDSLARQANVSVEVMHRMIAEGAKLAKAIGYSGATGAQITQMAFQTARSVQAPVMGPAGKGGFLSSTEYQMAGGTPGIQAATTTNIVSFLGSGLFKRSAALYQLAREKGIDNQSLLGGTMQGNIPDEEAAINALIPEYVNKLPAHLTKGMNAEQKRKMARTFIRRELSTRGDTLADRFLRGMRQGDILFGGARISNVDVMQMAARAQYREAMEGVMGKDKEIMRMHGAKFNNLSEKQRKVVFEQQLSIMQQQLQTVYGFSEAESRAQGEILLNLVHGGAPVENLRRQEARTRMNDIRTQAMEANRVFDKSILEKVWGEAFRKEGTSFGRLAQSILPGGELQYWMMGPDGKTPKLDKGKLGQFVDSALPWHYTESSLTAYEALKATTGKSIISFGEGKAIITRQEKMLKRTREAGEDTAKKSLMAKLGWSDKQYEKYMGEFIKHFDGNRVTLKAVDRFANKFIEASGVQDKQSLKTSDEVQAMLLRSIQSKNKNRYDEYVNLVRGTKTALGQVSKDIKKPWQELDKVELGIFKKWQAGDTLTEKEQETIKSRLNLPEYLTKQELVSRMYTQIEDISKTASKRRETLVDQQGQLLADIRGNVLLGAKEGMGKVTKEDRKRLREMFGFKTQNEYKEFATKKLEELKGLKTDEQRADYIKNLSKELAGKLERPGALSPERMSKFLAMMASTVPTKEGDLWGTFSDEMKVAQAARNQKPTDLLAKILELLKGFKGGSDEFLKELKKMVSTKKEDPKSGEHNLK